jgi:hypothetical protein
MAGNGSRGGSGRSSGGITARGKSGAGGPSVPSADQKAMQDSINRIQRYRNYMLSSNGGRLTPDDAVIFQANRRLATKQNKAIAQGGMRVSVRSKAAAAARYRINADRNISSANYDQRYGSGNPTTLVGRRSGTTRGQGNLLTGGFSDVVRGRRMTLSRSANTGGAREKARDRRGRRMLGL